MDSPAPIQFHGGRVMLHHGDAREMLTRLEDNSVDSIVTDPPYALESIKKRFGKSKSHLEVSNNKDLGTIKSGQYRRVARGFMGCKWDTGDTTFKSDFWAEVLRVLKPGGYAFIFGGDRTYHRLACAIEDGGFEIRRMFIWAYGSGFTKKGYIFKDDDGKPQGPLGGEVKPAIEPICCARKPLSEKSIAANVLRWGTGGLNIDGCRVATDWQHDPTRRSWQGKNTDNISSGTFRWTAGNKAAGPHNSGRWPANLVHDGSEEVLACFPKSEPSGSAKNGRLAKENPERTLRASKPVDAAKGSGTLHNDSGSAARFFASFPLTEDDNRIFYSAKADSHDRAGAAHPTVKPVALLQWLVRLITPKGGVCLDPFAGTGTTAEAAFREGMRCVLIEREDKYVDDIKRRMKLMFCGPDERLRESIKARGLVADAGPLFEEQR